MQAWSSPYENFGYPRNQGNDWDEKEPEETHHMRAEEYINPTTRVDNTLIGGSDEMKKISSSRRMDSERKILETLEPPPKTPDIKNRKENHQEQIRVLKFRPKVQCVWNKHL